MTNKAQTMLTIALTAAVSALLVDRTIEPAQAQDCATLQWTLMEMQADVANMGSDMEILGMNAETTILKLEAIEYALRDIMAAVEKDRDMAGQILGELIRHREEAE